MSTFSPQEQVNTSNSIFDWITKNRSLAFYWIVLSSVFFFFLYYATFEWLIATWSNDKPYSHGFFVPFITLYLVWIKRDYLRNLPKKSSIFLGGLLILLCSALLLLGRIGAIIQLEVISLYFIFPSIILFLTGWRILKALLFPLFYLQFMIPWTDYFLKYIYPFFREVAATLGTWFLELKYPVYRDQTFIYLPDITLSVVSACSGVNFLISVTAVGMILAYLTQKSWKRLGVVLIFGGIITIFVNGVRVALAGVLGQEYGVDMLHGPGHIFRGWFVAQAGWVGVFILNYCVAKIPHPSNLYLFERWKNRTDNLVTNSNRQNDEVSRLTVAGLICFFVIFFVYLTFFAMPQQVNMPSGLKTFPRQIGIWQGSDVNWLKSEEYFPGVDQEIARQYQSQPGQSVYLYIGYFAKQNTSSRLVSYHSRPLFVGKKEMRLVIGTRTMLVNKSQPVIDSVKYQMFSWYQFIDGEITDPLKVKVKGVTDALSHRRNNGAIVLIASPELQGITGENIHTQEKFCKIVAPMIEKKFSEMSKW